MFTNKNALRKHYLRERRELDENERIETNRGITHNILEFEAYRKAGSVFVYVSTKYEIDTKAIIENAFEAGKLVCVPLCGKNGEMSAKRIKSLDELSEGRYGIPEPLLSSETIECPELVLAPALSCDIRGYRLGYGGGYYDRFLSRCHSPCIALCAESRLLERLPHNGFDRRCEWVATERQVLHTYEEQ